MAKITFQNVTKKYGSKTVLDQLTLKFPEQGFVCITGPSGVGKSTIFNLLLQLTDPDAGEIRITDARQDWLFSAVFQEDRLLSWETVLENVLLPFSSIKKIPDNVREKAITILTELGLGKELNSYPEKLSGGMARRVSIARALIVDADIYIMDEPTKGLDDDNRQQVLQIIHKYTDQSSSHSGSLLLMITHRPDETEGSVLLSIQSPFM